MPCPPRIDFPDAVYHVTSRGNGRAEIFWTDDDRQRFLGQLSHHLQMTGVVLYAYVLMDNHILCGGGQAQEFVTYDVLKEYGRDQAAARRQYRAYVEACLLEDDAPLLEAMAASRYAIGEAAFTEQTEDRIEERRSGRVQDRDVDLPRWTIALEEIDAAVARRYGVDPAILKTHGHHAGPAKAAAVAVASRLANLSGRLIGQHYGIGSAAIGAIHRRLADRPNALEIVESLTKQLRRKRIKYKA